MNNIPTINEIDNNSPSQDSKDIVISATVNQPQTSEVEEAGSAKATIDEIDASRKPTISEIYQILNDGLFEATTNWWDYSYKLSQAQINQDIISRLDKGIIGGGYNKPGVDIITTTSTKTPTNTNVYSALKSDSLYPKKLDDEKISGVYDFLNGLTVGKFTESTGARIYPDSYGYSHLDVDYLNVRLKAIFETLQILNVETIGGKMVISPAGSIRISYVETINKEIDGIAQDVYRCYFLGEQDGNEIDNKWKVGDQAQAKSFNVKKGTYHKVGNHYLWRLVVGVSEEPLEINGNKYHYVELSDIDCAAGSDIPQPGDVLNQLGYRGDDVQRQAALVFSAVDGNAPSITLYSGINDYNMTGKEYVEYGVVAGKAYFNVYGETYIGARDKSTYIDFHNGKLNIKADISAASVGDKTLIQYIDANKGLNKDQVQDIADGVKEDLQKQIDNTIETWFYNGEPTDKNLPAVEWKTDKIDVRKSHVGDLYYDQNTGYAYRYTEFKDDNNPYQWIIIKDTAIAKALSVANTAKATADGKMDIFNAQPKSYKKGDIWVNATYGGHFNNDIVVALKDNDTFDIADWQLASRYDESLAELQNFTNKYDELFKGIKDDYNIIKTQVDGKAQTYYQAEQPTWSDTDKNHVGDIWYDTINKVSKVYIKDKDGTYKWADMEVPDEIFNSIDGKSSIFVDNPNSLTADSPINKGYKERDIWILPCDYTIGENKYKKGEILTAINDRSTFEKTDWTKLVSYTDNEKVDKVVANINGFMGATDVLDEKFRDAAKDGIFNAAEKTAILKEVDTVKDVQSRINATIASLLKSEYLNDADKKELNTKGKELEDAQNTFNTNIDSYLTYITENVKAGTYTALDERYYANRQTYVSTAIKTIQDAISATELYINIQTKDSIIGEVTSQYGYLAEAIKKGTTNIKGGLVSTNTIILSDILDTEGNYVVTAGINGQRTKNGSTNLSTIAAWFGGPMEDKDIAIANNKNAKAGTDYAMSVFRHDGTGYLAGGKISWDDKGVLTINPDSILANITTMGGNANLLYAAMLFQYFWKNNNNSTFDNLLYVNPLRSFSTLNIINNLVVGYSDNVATDDSFIQIGKIKLSYDATNKALKISHIGSDNANVYATGNIAAYGAGSTSSSGGGIIGTVKRYTDAINIGSDNETTNIASAYSIAALSARIDNIKNELSGLNLSWSNITGKPTTFTPSAHTHNYVSTINVGSTSYSVKDNVVSIPAYPTSLPANDVYAWAKSETKPSYNWSEIESRPTKVSDFTNDAGYTTNKGTVTSVGLSVPTGLSVSSTPITTSGTIAISFATGYSIPKDSVITNINASISTNTTNIETLQGYFTDGTANNADKLDGVHLNEIFTAFGNSGNNITATIGGITKTFTVGYATKANQLTTSRSLWGNSFNGTANVNGSITINNTDGVYIQIGGIRLVYDKTNAAIKVVQSDGTTAANLYATGGISAYGSSSVGGGSGFNGSVLSLTSIRNTTISDTDYTKIPNAAALKNVDSRLTNIETNGATSISVTGTGNAITSVSKDSTIITFTKGTTFLTSHQSLSGYATESWVKNQGYLTSHQSLSNYVTTSDSRLSDNRYPKFANNTWYLVGDDAYIGDHNLGGYFCIKGNNSNISGISLWNYNENDYANIWFDNANLNINKQLVVANKRIWIQGVGTAGGNNNRLTLVSGMPSGLAYNASCRGTILYSNGIAFADPYNGNSNNDSGWIRHLESSANTGLLEIAVGDDNSNEEIHFRWYDTTSTSEHIGNDITVPRATGTLALTSEIPTNLNQLSNGPGYVTGSVSGNTITINGTSTTWQNTWRGITDSYGGTSTSVSLSQKGANDLYNALNSGYASSAGNADTVDGYHATSGRTFDGDINWGSWNDVWSDGTNTHPWYGFDHRYPNTGVYSTTISDYFGMTIKTSYNALRLDCPSLDVTGLINTNASAKISKVWIGLNTNSEVRNSVIDGDVSDGLYLQYYSNRFLSLCNGGGNVGIGTNSPSYRLHVNGTAHANLFHVSNGNHTGIQLGSTYLSCLDGNAIFQNNTAIRFGNDAWDWNQWAGLKYVHSSKTIYLGLADGSIFSANSAQTGGTVSLVNCSLYVPNNITASDSIYSKYLYSATSIDNISNRCIQIAGNTIQEYHNESGGSPYHSYITLKDTSIIAYAYGSVDIETGPGDILLNSGTGNIVLSSNSGIYMAYRGASFYVSQTNASEYTWYMNCIKANGNIFATGGITAYSSSDIRLKSNIKVFDYIKTIKSLGNVYEFDYIKDGEHSIGLIAQNVQKSNLADLVSTDDEGYLKLNYWSPKLISLALGGITQIDDEVTRLKARVRELENEVKQLKNK